MSRVGLVLVAMLAAAASASAKSAEELARALSDPKKAEAALDELVKMGAPDGLRALQGEAAEGKDLAARGWAIAGLGEIGGEHAAKTLLDLQEKGSPVLVQSWAAAARVNSAPDVATLVTMGDLLQRFPATDRPFKERLKAVSAKDPKAAESLLKLSADWRFQAMIGEPILALGTTKLIDAMLRGSDVTTRQQAAAYLGVLAQNQGAAANETVGLAFVRAIAFDPKAKDTPWAGGALFLPGIAWDRPTALKLTRELVAWDVFLVRNNRSGDRNVINNNMNVLAGFVGYQPNWQTTSTEWLRVWSSAAGRAAGLAILEEQGLHKDPVWTGKLPGS